MQIAALQMTSCNRIQDNLLQAKHLLEQAVDQGASLAVLPEMFALFSENPKETLSAAEMMGNGLIQDFISTIAKKNNLWIIAGTIPIRCNAEKKVRAASLVFNAEGNCVARYDKIHLYDADISATERYRESDGTEAGTKAVIVDTPLGKVGLAVCYDIRFPELFRTLVNRGAEIFVIPAAFTVKTGKAHWELLARARAVENFCYVVGACQGGTHSKTRRTFGDSIIVNPWGEIIIKQSGTMPGVITAKIDKEALCAIRQAMPVLKHQFQFYESD